MKRRQLLYTFIAALATLIASCAKNDVNTDLKGTNDDNTITSVTQWIDEVLCEMYLYNEEYAALPSRDYTLSYDTFLEQYLTSLTTNVLDYKTLPSGTKHLFSYITRTENALSSSSSLKAQATNYGFVALTSMIDAETDKRYFYIAAIYNNTPASAAGLRRGAMIYAVNGVEITESTSYDLLYSLYYPSSGDTTTLSYYEQDESGEQTHKSVTLTASAYEANPVFKSEIIYSDANVGNIGYLNYLSFEYEFDSEMLAAFKGLRESGADHLILDLRYNLGGYVSSASKMVSAITDAHEGTSQIFQYYRFNDDMTTNHAATSAMVDITFDSDEGKFYETLSGVSSDYALQLSNKTIYCLVSFDTASASEMVINALRGMGSYDVVLVGETTRGKNVGMFVSDILLGNYKYELVPITFENYNCNIEGGYEDGFTPDYEVVTSFETADYCDFSADERVISSAISLITTGNIVGDNIISGVTRSTSTAPQFVRGDLGAKKIIND